MHRSARSRAFCVAKKFEKIHRDSRKKEGDETARDTILDLPSICFFTREFFVARVNAFQLITHEELPIFLPSRFLTVLLSFSLAFLLLLLLLFHLPLRSIFSLYSLLLSFLSFRNRERKREQYFYLGTPGTPGIGFSVNLSIMRHDGWIGNFRSIMRIPNIYIYV